jgi:uncharacterized membrane protein YqgA involved in biofilm formation
MLGTIVNATAVLVGGTLGLIFKAKLAERFSTIIFQAIGLFTLFLGAQMAFRTEKILIMVFSLVLGAIIGEIINIEKGLNRFSDNLQSRFKTKNEQFNTGLITAFMLFCMGSMTILGAFEEGLGQSSELLFTKSLMDGFSSIILAATFGIGVLFSVIPLLLYQGGLTLFASELSAILTEPIIREITAVGGILLLGLGLNILNITKIRITNMLPALIVVGVLSWLT